MNFLKKVKLLKIKPVIDPERIKNLYTGCDG